MRVLDLCMTRAHYEWRAPWCGIRARATSTTRVRASMAAAMTCARSFASNSSAFCVRSTALTPTRARMRGGGRLRWGVIECAIRTKDAVSKAAAVLQISPKVRKNYERRVCVARARCRAMWSTCVGLERAVGSRAGDVSRAPRRRLTLSLFARY